VSFNIDIAGYALAQAKVLRQQLLGLADNADEPVVPVTDSNDSDYDGFYWVRSVQVDPTIVYQRDGTMRCQISLERVGGGYARPVFEIPFAVATLTNSHTIEGGRHVGIPATTADWALFDTGSSVTRSSSTGNVFWIYTKTGVSGLRDPGVLSYYVAPASYYVGACVIEQSVGGTWYPIQGDQVSLQLDAWRISNGIIRLTPQATSPRSYLFERWNGSAWVTICSLERGNYAGSYVDEQAASSDPVTASTGTVPFITRNGPDCVTVVIPQLARQTESITIHRGNEYARFYIARNGYGSAAHWMGSASAVAMSDVTYGGYATANINGYRLGIATPPANDVDTVNGRVKWTSGAVGGMFIVWAQVHLGGVDGGTDTWPLFGPMSTIQQVVAR
jgi:hypothetical protein